MRYLQREKRRRKERAIRACVAPLFSPSARKSRWSFPFLFGLSFSPSVYMRNANNVATAATRERRSANLPNAINGREVLLTLSTNMGYIGKIYTFLAARAGMQAKISVYKSCCRAGARKIIFAPVYDLAAAFSASFTCPYFSSFLNYREIHISGVNKLSPKKLFFTLICKSFHIRICTQSETRTTHPCFHLARRVPRIPEPPVRVILHSRRRVITDSRFMLPDSSPNRWNHRLLYTRNFCGRKKSARMYIYI